MWFGSNSYITAKLTGEYVLDHHTASQCDPLYNTSSFDWNHEWAQRICRHLPLPRLAWPDEVVGTVTAAAAAATGIPAGTPVVTGTVDALAEAFSVGVRDPRRPHAHVRLDDVHRPGGRRLPHRSGTVDDCRGGGTGGHLRAGGGNSHCGQPDRLDSKMSPATHHSTNSPRRQWRCRPEATVSSCSPPTWPGNEHRSSIPP